MSLSFARRSVAAIAVGVALAGSAAAQGVPTLEEATDAAWRLSASARSLDSRRAELDARDRAASSFLAAPPTVSLSQKNGRGEASGLRETEAEISAPIWQGGLRRATTAQVAADRAALDAQIAAARLKLAAQARELAAQAASARVEGEGARRRAQEAGTLAADLERRVKAGESARLDLLRAQSEQRAAQAAAAQAEAALVRALSAWRALTGLPAVAALDESRKAAAEHPALLAARTQADAARAKLAATEADRRDPMEVGVGVGRERPERGAAWENSVRLSLRVPLGGDIRNASRIAAARVEADTALAEAEATARQVAAEREASERELEAALAAERLAVERERFAVEAQGLVAKAYRLGEVDLPTRLRADAERFDAEISRSKAAIEARRALTQLNQDSGATP